MAYSKYTQAAAITTEDSDHGVKHDAIWVGTADTGTTGNIKAIFANDSSAVVLKNVTEGTFLPFEIKQFVAHVADHTMTDFVGLESGERWSD